ncbi:major capsid protein [Enterobacter asburiae]|uniref:major capsid protein n=1 Tax=Enterobacter asburiae TaxID=61645 RepID=UPI003BBEFFC2
MDHQFNIYDTMTLVEVVPNLMTSQQFLLNRFFPNVVESDTEFVAIDVDVGRRRMAPFCSPLVAGQLVESRRYQTNLYKPPYIKDKRAPDLRKPIRRQIGEQIGGNIPAADKAALNMMFEMTDQIDVLNRRQEWMAANAMMTGTITVVGEGLDTEVIDFQRDPALTIALSGADKWPQAVAAGATNNKPTQDIERWQTLILQKSGAVATDLIFTNASWAAFRLDTTIKDNAITWPAMSPFGNQVDAGARVELGAVYKGRWGQFDLWLYNDWFIDPVDDVEKPMLADGAVIMSGPNLMGTRAYGAIIDPEFNYGALAYAPKTWTEKDPAQRFLLMQSAPLVIPSRVNAALCATVV